MPLTLECMDIILTDIQARRAQRMARQERSTLRFARRMPVSEGAICPPALLEQVVRPVLESLDIVHANEPIHLRVFGVGRKTRCVDLQLHRTTVHMPPNSFDCVVPTDAEVGLTLNIGKHTGWQKAPDVEAIHHSYEAEIEALNAQLEDANAEIERLTNGESVEPVEPTE